MEILSLRSTEYKVGMVGLDMAVLATVTELMTNYPPCETQHITQ